jgi:DNA-binding NtrC family response regulator
VIFTRGYPIQAADLPPQISDQGSLPGRSAAGPDEPRWLDLIRDYLNAYHGASAHEHLLEQVERLLLAEALERSRGNQTHAARLLGLARPTLHAKLQRYGLRDTGALNS